MAPEVVQWTLVALLLLVVVWIGAMALALSWLLSRPAVLLTVIAATVLLAYAAVR